MIHETKRQLKRLSNKQIEEDVKKYIKNSHDFYRENVPEIKVLAKKLHEKNSLKEFYSVFNRLWSSGYHNERSLALYALKLYKEDYNLRTWKFIKPILKELKNWDEIDYIAKEIVSEFILKYEELKPEIYKLSRKRNLWLRRLTVFSCLKLVNRGKLEDIEFVLKILSEKVYDISEKLQESAGLLLKELLKEKPKIGSNFILKHKDMSELVFKIATEKIRESKKSKKKRSLKKDKRGFWS